MSISVKTRKRSRPGGEQRDKPRPAAVRAPRADLHIHTTHSDGVCSPCEVVVAAERVGLSALAITDHDTITAITVARPEAERLGIELVSGVELTTEMGGREYHVLGHFIDETNPELASTLDAMRLGRAERLAAMVEKLREFGLSVDLKALRTAFPRATLGRRHLADWLTRTGQVSGTREVFTRFLGDQGPVQVPKPRLALGFAIGLVRRAGGVAGLAHPPYDLRESTLREMVDAGLGAIEVAGPAVDSTRGRRWKEWAELFGLVPIAGSDFHASDRPGRWIGSTTVEGAELERLRARRGT